MHPEPTCAFHRGRLLPVLQHLLHRRAELTPASQSLLVTWSPHKGSPLPPTLPSEPAKTSSHMFVWSIKLRQAESRPLQLCRLTCLQSPHAGKATRQLPGISWVRGSLGRPFPCGGATSDLHLTLLAWRKPPSSWGLTHLPGIGWQCACTVVSLGLNARSLQQYWQTCCQVTMPPRLTLSRVCRGWPTDGKGVMMAKGAQGHGGNGAPGGRSPGGHLQGPTSSSGSAFCKGKARKDSVPLVGAGSLPRLACVQVRFRCALRAVDTAAEMSLAPEPEPDFSAT